MLPPCVLWIDPGGMTGLAWLYESGAAFYADEFGFQDAGEQIESTCIRWGPALFIGWERYWIDRNRPQTDAASAIEVIGVARWHAQRARCHILPEANPYTPKPPDRAQLEAIGWWVKGKDDAQSAACHMLRWLRKTGNLPPAVAQRLSEAAGTV